MARYTAYAEKISKYVYIYVYVYMYLYYIYIYICISRAF